MNSDILSIKDGEDIVIDRTVIPKASNVVSVQLGSLEYAPSFGSDLRYFIENEVAFQNESFKSYLVDRLVQHQISVSDVIATIDTFYERFTFSVGDANDSKGMIL